MSRDWKDREPCFVEILRRECPGVPFALDIGANNGEETVFMLKHGVDKVHACEPDDRMINICVNRIKRGRAIIENIAIGRDGEIDFYKSQMPHLNSVFPTRHTDSVPVKVRSKSIDSLKQRHNLIKMDIEGGELEVFRGGHNTWKEQYPCKILWETHPPYPSAFRAELDYLLGCGFHFKYLVSATTIQPRQFSGHTPSWVPENTARAIYEGIPDEECIEILCNNQPEFCPIKKKRGKSVRFAMLERA